MKIYIQGEGNTNWIINEIVEDFKKFTKHEIVSENPDLVWCVISF